MLPPIPALFTDLYELTMAQAYLAEGLTDRAVFSLFVLIVLDRLIFVRLRPGFVVLPGTGEAPALSAAILIAPMASPANGGIAAGVTAITGG